MAKKSNYDEGVVAETGKWNTAKAYSELMIMQPLYECKEYRTICYHGTSQLIDDFIINEDDKTKAKLFALERYVTTLKSLISDTLKQIKPQDEPTFTNYKTILDVLYSYLPMAKRKIQRLSYHTGYSDDRIVINAKTYDLIFRELCKINEDVSGILTQNNLIFYQVEEFDEDRARKDFMERLEDEA